MVDGNASGGNGSAVGAGPAQAGDAGGDGQWHVNVSETDQRSMSLAELVDAYNSSVVTQETYIWTDGMDDWKPLGEVDAVVSALHAAAGGGGAPAAETENEDQPTQAFSYEQAQAAGYGTPFDDRRAAAAAPEPGCARAPTGCRRQAERRARSLRRGSGHRRGSDERAVDVAGAVDGARRRRRRRGRSGGRVGLGARREAR